MAYDDYGLLPVLSVSNIGFKCELYPALNLRFYDFGSGGIKVTPINEMIVLADALALPQGIAQAHQRHEIILDVLKNSPAYVQWMQLRTDKGKNGIKLGKISYTTIVTDPKNPQNLLQTVEFNGGFTANVIDTSEDTSTISSKVKVIGVQIINQVYFG